jgi:hypothetical protein
METAAHDALYILNGCLCHRLSINQSSCPISKWGRRVAPALDLDALRPDPERGTLSA